jgi:monovalent cation/hydrogen antiporter
MIDVLLTCLALAISVALLSVAAQRWGLASSILLLVAGAAASFVPAMPQVALDPDVVLLLLLPPLLYFSGVGMSWRGFRSNLRPILLLAIGCVLATTAAVAAVAHYALGLPWALGFLLGAIVSPPDAIAPMAVMQGLGLPRRLTTILEGESLVNDATALVTFSFALGAVTSGDFSLASAAVKFLGIVAGELGFGIAIGFAMLRLRHLVRDPRAEVLLAIATPFIAFWPPHELGGSGVVACVAAGLAVSWNGRRLIRPATRLQGYFIWDLIAWGAQGLVFLLTGLQARSVAAGLSEQNVFALLGAGALIAATVVIIRFIWVYPATYLPRLLSPSLRERDPYPDWRRTFLVAFTGLRGVVSLAAALSIPAFVGGGEQPFPDRALVLFLTFCVIVVTLVGQGTALPWIVRWLELGRAGADEALANRRDEHAVRLEAIGAALTALERAEADGAPAATIQALRKFHSDRRTHLSRTADESTSENPVTDMVSLQLRLIDAEREAIATAYEANRITDEARRRIERELDLEEARARHSALNAGDVSLGVADMS